MAHRADTYLVVGAGGHGRVVADLIRALGHRVAGYVDDDAAKLAKDAQDEDFVGIVKTDVLKSPCPMYEEIKEDK